MSLTHLSLFTGIGGLDLAAELAGFKTIGQVEQADYPYRVLCRHWPDVPKWRNVEDVTADALRTAGIEHRPTVLSGGFPCQPFSCAGKRKGAEDDRFLWPEMLRVVQELRPAWVVGENVAGLIGMALDDVLADVERAGYACRTFVFPAAGVGAPHQRDRVFIVAHDDCRRQERARIHVRQWVTGKTTDDTYRGGADVAHSARKLPHRGGRARDRGREPADGGCDVPDANLIHDDRRGLGTGAICQHRSAPSGLWFADPTGRLWQSEPAVGRVADGVPSRVDRLRALGNAVVPQQAYPIFAAIAVIEGARPAPEADAAACRRVLTREAT